MAVEGLDAYTATFKLPVQYTSGLSSYILVAQLFHLEEGFLSAARLDSDNDDAALVFLDAFRDYHRRAIADQSMTPIVEQLSLRAYASSRAIGHNTKPTCSFNADNSILYYQEHTIHLDDIKNIAVSLIKDALQLLYMKLIFQAPASYLPNRSPVYSKDNLQ